MERFVKFVYCRRTRNNDDDAPPPSTASSSPHVDPSSSSATVPTEVSRQRTNHEAEHDDGRAGDGTRPLGDFLRRIALGGNKLLKSVHFWGLFGMFCWDHTFSSDTFPPDSTALQEYYHRGITLGCCAFGVCLFLLSSLYATLYCSMSREDTLEFINSRHERVKQITSRIKKILHSLGQLRDEQPGLFCIAACSASMIVWLLDYALNGMLLKYLFLTFGVLITPAVVLLPVRKRIPAHPPPSNRRESDSEIEEFLPAATETNIQILEKAGDVGEYSPTPTTVTETPKEHEEQEFLNDGDLAGHKMPSHEDGSSDGLELSDLELSEKSSTSSCSGQSDSEFEIIDRQEIGKLCTPQDTKQHITDNRCETLEQPTTKP